MAHGAWQPRRAAAARLVVASFVSCSLAGGIGARSDQLGVSEEARLGFECIRQQCVPAIAAVREAGGELLYRGAPRDVNVPKKFNEDPDLLDPATYGENGAAYFRRLERYIERLDAAGKADSEKGVRPSNGHIAVANLGEAAAWGQACSCWPIGNFNYLFFASSRLIYPLAGAQEEHESEGRVFERDLRINEGLKIGKVAPSPWIIDLQRIGRTGWSRGTRAEGVPSSFMCVCVLTSCYRGAQLCAPDTR